MEKLSEYVASLNSGAHLKELCLERRGKLKAACAKALVLHGAKKVFDAETVYQLAGKEIYVPVVGRLRSVCGGIDGVAALVSSGLASDVWTPPWTPAFVHGLIDSGGLTKAEGHRATWFVETGREDLLASLGSLGVSGRLGGSVRGRRLLLDFWLPYAPDEPLGEPRRLAGAIAGGRPTRSCGQSWLAFSPGRVGVLRKYGIVFNEGDRFVRRVRVGKNLLVSPFYAGAMSGLMPVELSRMALSFESPGACPLMPLCYWKMCVAERRRCLYEPCADVLPYAGGLGSANSEGWSSELLGRAALEEFDIGWVHPCLGGELRRRFLMCDSCSRKKGCRE